MEVADGQLKTPLCFLPQNPPLNLYCLLKLRVYVLGIVALGPGSSMQTPGHPKSTGTEDEGK